MLLSASLLPTVSLAVGGISPGTVINPIDKPVYQPEREQTPQITQEEKPAPEVPQSAVKVRVNDFRFQGNTTFSEDVLNGVIRQYEGKDLSIAEIYHVADLVEIYYRANGYLLTSVYVPAQRINSGTILLEVIEGRLGALHIEGELGSYDAEYLKAQLDGLQPGEIIDDDTLESETLLLSDLPGLSTRAVIKPGEAYGTSDIVFISEEKRYSGSLSVNNFGRKSIGENRVEAGLFMANPFFQGDAINFSGIAAQDSRMLYGRLDYDARVTRSGTQLGLSYSVFNYDVDIDEIGLPSNQTLGGGGSNIIVRASHPLQRSTRNNTTLLLDVRRSVTTENGSAAVRPDAAINLLEVFLSWDHSYHDYARSAIHVGLATNFKQRKDLLDSSSQKAKLSVDLRHYQPFLKTWFVNARAQAVYSPDPLVDVERFRIGGQGSVRAFPSAELAGDKGGVVSLDVGVNIGINRSFILIPKVFADAGKVFRYEPVGVPDSESLAGYGAGLSAVIARNHTLDVEVVKPTTDRSSSDGRGTRYWLNYRGIF